MSEQDLGALYREYLACLNDRDLGRLASLVHDTVEYNGQPVGLVGYQTMLEGDFEAIPDLRFQSELLVVQPPHVAARLVFDCTPEGELFGLAVNGQRVRFSENVFYAFSEGKIQRVWSVIDKATIRAQLDSRFTAT